MLGHTQLIDNTGRKYIGMYADPQLDNSGKYLNIIRVCFYEHPIDLNLRSFLQESQVWT